jgi:hypothetical protein
MTGIPSIDDFIIRTISKCYIHSHTNNGNGQGGNRPSFTDSEETIFVKVERNKLSDEPYLFFCPNNPRTTVLFNDFTRYYEYLACNSGFGNLKKAIFYNSNAEKINITDISSIHVLNQLRDFILQQINSEHPTFCNTILTAVEAELERKRQ